MLPLLLLPVHKSIAQALDMIAVRAVLNANRNVMLDAMRATIPPHSTVSFERSSRQVFVSWLVNHNALTEQTNISALPLSAQNLWPLDLLQSPRQRHSEFLHLFAALQQ
jgi:hypothetical protein